MKDTIKKIFNTSIFKKSEKKSSLSFVAGFTLVEVLIATAIFAIAITGIITVSVQGSMNVNSAKNRVTANYLAQEGIELVRANRDSYVLSDPTSYQDGWNAFVASLNEDCTGPCGIDVGALSNLGPSGTGYISCVPGGGGSPAPCLLMYNSDGFYVYGTSGTPTPFTREITFTPYYAPSAPSQVVELEITSTVTWMEGSTMQSVALNESLFDWYSINN